MGTAFHFGYVEEHLYVFRETFTGNSVSTTFQLTGNVGNATFETGSWTVVNVETAMASDASKTTGAALYDSLLPLVRHKITVSSISATGLVTLNYAPLAENFYVWYWYDMEGDAIQDYYRDDYVSSMEADAGVTIASGITVDVAAFGGLLDSADNTVQKALDSIDDLTISSDYGLTGTVTAGNIKINTSQDLQAAASPIFATVKLSGLTDGYVPYHVSDALGLANGPIWTDGTKVGIGTAAVPHAGIGTAQIAIEGADSSAGYGPHIQITTSADDYPIFQMLNMSHDGVYLTFDGYYDSAWRQSDLSVYQIGKVGDALIFRGWCWPDPPGTAFGFNSVNFALKRGTRIVEAWAPFINLGDYASGYPALQIYGSSGSGTSNDNCGLLFDAHFEGTAWESSDSSMFRLWKLSDALRIDYDVKPGPTYVTSWPNAPAFAVTSTGKIGFGTETVPHGGIGTAQIAIDGPTPYMQFTDSDAGNYPYFSIYPPFLAWDSYLEGGLWYYSFDDLQVAYRMYAASGVFYLDAAYRTPGSPGDAISSWSTAIGIRNQWSAASLVGINCVPTRYWGSGGGATLEVAGYGGYGWASGIWFSNIGIDTAPSLCINSYNHDDSVIAFDASLWGSWYSHDAGSNFLIQKYSDLLTIKYAAGKTADSTFTWDGTALSITSAGLITINKSLTIGEGAAGVDYTLTFDGETYDGVITWWNAGPKFKFSHDVNVMSGTYANIEFAASDAYIAVGRNDTLEGYLKAHGSASGAQGGTLQLFTGADHDAVFHYFVIQAYEDDLLIGPSSDTDALKLDNAGDLFVTAGTISCSDLTDGYVPYHVSDAAGLANSVMKYVDANGMGIGVNDTTYGALHLYGDDTESAIGGDLLLYTAADHDTTIDYFQIIPYEDDLLIGPSTDADALKLNNAGDFFITAGTISCSDLTDGYVPYHVSDAAGLANSSFRSNADVGACGGTSAAYAQFRIYQDNAFSSSLQEGILIDMFPSAVTKNDTNYVIGQEIVMNSHDVTAGKADSGYRRGLAVYLYPTAAGFAGTINILTGLFVSVGTYGVNPTGTVTTAYGIYNSDIFGVNSVIGTYYGIYQVNTLSAGTNWGIYQATAGVNNYFGGQIGIACTPVARLEVEDGATTASMLVKITQDDATPFGLVIGNDTYSTTDTNGLRFIVSDTGDPTISWTGTNFYLGTSGDLDAFKFAGGDLLITAGTISCSDLTDGYVPYHVSDAAGLANSVIYQDSGGNIGINSSDIEAWNASYRAIELGGYIQIMYGGGTLWIMRNAYYDGAWKYKEAATSSNIYLDGSGYIEFQTAVAGAADAALTWVTPVYITPTFMALNSSFWIQTDTYSRVWTPGPGKEVGSFGDYGPGLTYNVYYCATHNQWEGIGGGAGNYFGLREGSFGYYNTGSIANGGDAVTWYPRLIMTLGGCLGVNCVTTIANLEVEDGGTAASMLVKITQDDTNVWGLMIGNDTYSTTDIKGLGFYVDNSGNGSISCEAAGSLYISAPGAVNTSCIYIRVESQVQVQDYNGGTPVTNIILNPVGVPYIVVGFNDTTYGIIGCYGHAAGSTAGGVIRSYLAADHDTTIDYFDIKTVEDDLLIGPSTDEDALKLDALKDLYITAGSLLVATSEYVNFGTTQGITGYGLSDVSTVVKTRHGIAGSQWTPTMNTPSKCLDIVDDFGAYGGLLYLGISSPLGFNFDAGSLSGSNQGASQIDTTSFGITQLLTGTNAAGAALMYGNSLQLTGGIIELEIRLKLNALSDGTDDYTVYAGFGDKTDADDIPTEGLYFVYNDGLNAGDWTSYCTDEDADTTDDLDTPASTNWVRLKIVVNADASSVDFYINDVLVGTTTTNIPDAGDSLMPFVQIVKSGGTTTRHLYVDYVHLKCHWAR